MLPGELHDELAKARFALVRHRVPEAVRRLETILQVDPAHLPAAILRSTLAVYAGDLEAAFSWISPCETSEPSVELAQFQARLLFVAQRYEEVAKTVETASPLRPEIALLSGKIEALGSPFHKEAWEFLATWLRDDSPVDVPLEALLTPLANPADRSEAAILMIRAFLSAFRPPALIGRLVSHLVRAELVGSQPLLKSILADDLLLVPPLEMFAELPPPLVPNPHILVALARQFDAEEQTTLALSYAEEALSRGTPSLDTLTLNADLCRKLKLFERAAELIQLAETKAADPATTLRKLTLLEWEACQKFPLRNRAKLNELLKRSITQARRKAASDPAARFGLAQWLIKAGETREAEELLVQILQEKPDHAGARAERLQLAQWRGDQTTVNSLTDEILAEGFDERAFGRQLPAPQAEGDVEGLNALFARFADVENQFLSSERVRHRFYLGELEPAREAALRYLETNPGDGKMRLLLSAIERELGNAHEADFQVLQVAANPSLARRASELTLFLYAANHSLHGPKEALVGLDEMFAGFGAQSVRLAPHWGGEPFDQLVGSGRYPDATAASPLVFHGPLVSVIMTTYNSAEFVTTAVRSILQQSYRNLELIIVDDLSSDATPQILQQFAARDPRIRLISKSLNEGTYVGKNLGLQEARGEILAFQDSDDWSHPDRLAMSVAALQAAPHIMAVRTSWLRMLNNGQVVVRPKGHISNPCCISLVMKRAAFERVGFFDSVRMDADIEYVARLRLAHDPTAFPQFPWLLLFARAREDSLTTESEFGYSRTGFNPLRKAYRAAYRPYHAAIAQGADPYLPFPLKARPFAAPGRMLPARTNSGGS